MRKLGTGKLGRVVPDANRAGHARSQGYRERALKLLPGICGRWTREFTRANVPEFTVHHIEHDHLNNSDDGSKWRLLCIYCHDHERQRELEARNYSGIAENWHQARTHSPLADLKSLLGKGGTRDE